jgi:hypothetical protein
VGEGTHECIKKSKYNYGANRVCYCHLKIIKGENYFDEDDKRNCVLYFRDRINRGCDSQLSTEIFE